MNIKTSDLVLLGFKVEHQSLTRGNVLSGYRLLVELSDVHIRIRMSGCSCILMQGGSNYTLNDFNALLRGLHINTADHGRADH